MLPAAAKEKGLPSGREPQSFLFSSAGESRVIFGPLSVQIRFFFFFFFPLSQSPVSKKLQAGEKSELSF